MVVILADYIRQLIFSLSDPKSTSYFLVLDSLYLLLSYFYQHIKHHRMRFQLAVAAIALM